MRAAADLTAAARLCIRTTGCRSPAWQHAPQVLHKVAVDGAETLTVMAASTINVSSPSA